MKNEILDADFLGDSSKQEKAIELVEEIEKGELIWQRFTEEEFIENSKKYESKNRIIRKKKRVPYALIYAALILFFGGLVLSLFLRNVDYLGFSVMLVFFFFMFAIMLGAGDVDENGILQISNYEMQRIVLVKKWNIQLYEKGMFWIPIQKEVNKQFLCWEDLISFHQERKRIVFSTKKFFLIDDQSTRSLTIEFENIEEARSYYKRIKELRLNNK